MRSEFVCFRHHAVWNGNEFEYYADARWVIYELEAKEKVRDSKIRFREQECDKCEAEKREAAA